MRLPLAALVVITCAFSCADFDLQERIEDLRVIGIATEPAEVKYSAAHILAGPQTRPPGLPVTSVDVDYEVLAFEPRGGTLEVSAQFCPSGTCTNFDDDAFADAQPAVIRNEVRDAFGRNEVELELEPLAAQGGRLPGLNFTLPLSPGAIDALIPKAGGQPLPQFFPALPRVGVSVNNLDVEPFLEDGTRAVNREIAFKRLPVGLDFADPLLSDDIKSAFGDAFGVTFCEEPINSESFLEGPAPCFDPQPANLNPTLLGFQLLPEDAELPEDGIIEDAEVDLAPRGARLSVPRGGTVVVNPVFAAGVSQPYQIVRFLIEESVLEVENRFEDIVVTWYSTRGTIGQTVRQLQTGDTLGQVWNLSQTADPGDEDVLVAVARDQRGGTSFGIITVEYR